VQKGRFWPQGQRVGQRVEHHPWPHAWQRVGFLLLTGSMAWVPTVAWASSVRVPPCPSIRPGQYAIVVLTPNAAPQIDRILPPGASAQICALTPNVRQIVLRIGDFPQRQNAEGFMQRIRTEVTPEVELRDGPPSTRRT